MGRRPTGKMMFIDTSICMACRGCQVACKDWNQQKIEGHVKDAISDEWKTSFAYEGVEPYQNPPDMSGITYTVVRFKELENEHMNWLFFKDQCRHCTGGMGAPCQRACPVSGAIVTEAGGAIVMTEACDPQTCTRNFTRPRPCEEACPYNVPRHLYMEEGEEKGAEDKEKKCDFCFDRIAEDKIPRCAETCPPGAITFGSESYVQDVANQRLAEVRSVYPDANIYPNGHTGGHDGGGGMNRTRVIWLLLYDPSVYGLPTGLGGMGGM